MPDKHAFLSPSSADRWIHCPPSQRLNALIADKGTSYTQEGTEAHLLCEYELKHALGADMEDPRPNLQYYDQEMQDAADGYRDFIIGLLKDYKDAGKEPFICIEQHLDYSKWVGGNGFGTGDCLIVTDGTLKVIDFKFGIGVIVNAEKNPQMMCYALGALDMFDDLYDIDTISMTIYQPRRANISTYEMSRDDLLKWATDILSPAAKLAFAGQGEFNCGPWCRFCKIKGTCRKRAKENMEMAKCEFLETAMLDPDDISFILSKIDELLSWAEDFKKDALNEALGGAKIPNYKLVAGRSNRTYTNEDQVAKRVKKEGYDPYDHKLKGVTAMTKMLGKKEFNDLLSDLITKPQGKPALVPDTDPREALIPATNEFEGETE